VSTTVLPPQWANLVPDDNITLGRYFYNGHMKIRCVFIDTQILRYRG